jgi:hypothetical protein
MIIATETFQPAAELSKYGQQFGWNEGTVEVTFQGRTERVQCIAPKDGGSQWTIRGLCARYATGAKVWPATIWFDADKRTFNIMTGFDNRSGRFSQPRLVGFLADVAPQHVSQR